MSTHESFNALPRLVKCVAVAAALTLPSAAALSESMDLVKLRDDQNIDHPGRESVHAPVATIVVMPVENPLVYGRAGGYVGADRAAVLESRTSRTSRHRKDRRIRDRSPWPKRTPMRARRHSRLQR